MQNKNITINQKQDFNHILVVFSDIEMGSGGNLDDFPHSDFLGEIILSYNNEQYSNCQVDLVFNGDTFDLLKTSYDRKYPHLINKDIALAKTLQIVAAHPKFFEAVRKFLFYKNEKRQIYFIVGNHDPELLFPEVQQLIKSLCGKPKQVNFPGFELNIAEVHIEHGSQQDRLFKMDENKPFINFKGETLLNMPWGSVSILDVIMPVKDTFYHLDRLKPKMKVLQVVPEMKEWLVSSFWRYWTRDYLSDYLKSTDPLKKMSWSMLSDVMGKFISRDPEVSMNGYFQKQIKESNKYRLYVIGHQHESGWWGFGNRKLLQTGCFRNEFMIDNEGESLSPIPKTYAEVYLNDTDLIKSQLIEVMGPPVPDNYIPCTLKEFVPKIHEFLGTSKERAQFQTEIKKQEKKENTINVTMQEFLSDKRSQQIDQ